MKHIIGIALVASLGCGGGGQDGGTDASELMQNDIGTNMGQDIPVEGVFSAEDVVVNPSKDLVDDAIIDTQESLQTVTCEGDYLIENEADADAIIGCTEITGNLEVIASEVAELSLPLLVTVGGNLIIWKNTKLSSLLFPELVIIGGGLAVVDNVALRAFSFPKLTSVDSSGMLHGSSIALNESLLTFSLPSLESVGWHLSVSENSSMASFDLSSLSSVSGVFTVGWEGHGNPSLVEFCLPSLAWVEAVLTVRCNDSLEFFDLPLLFSTLILEIADNGMLTSFSSPSLMSVQYHVSVRENPVLVSFNLNSLTSVGKDLWWTSNSDLPQCLVDFLVAQIQAAEGIGGPVTTHGNNEDCTCGEVAGEVVATCQ